MKKSAMFSRAVSGTKAYAEADHLNPEGGLSFTRTLEERVVQALLTNTLDNTFYVSREELAKGVDETFREILANDPQFFAQAIVYARNEGCMRLVPIVGLVYLSTAEDKKPFYAAFRKVIQTPHDLATFVEWCGKSGIRGSKEVSGMHKPADARGTGLGTVGKKAINEWLTVGGKEGRGLTEYHVLKYPLNGQTSMKNIIRVARPKPVTAEQEALFVYAIHGAGEKLGDRVKLLPQVAAFEELKSATKPAEQLKLIEQGRLPYEAVTGAIKPDVDVWTALMRQMPHFAILRHLNTLERAGVLANEDNVKYVVGKLTDERAILNAKVLPFQYYQAWVTYTRADKCDCVDGSCPAKRDGYNQQVADAIVTALETSFQNLPEIPGHVVIGNDVSGSMSGRVSPQGATRYCDIAGIFAAALLKKSPDVRVLPADTGLVNIAVSRNDSIATNAEKLALARGGTDLGAAMQHVNEKRLHLDIYMGITDNVEWATSPNGYQGQSLGFYGEWVQRRNKDAKAFLVTISPYKDSAAPAGDASVHFISGWSASVLTYITLSLQGMGTQVERVRRVEL